MAKRTQLSFASFNLYNLNLPGHAMYRSKKGWSEAQYQKKIDWAAKMLKEIDAQVIGFQELWSKKALQAVFKKAGLYEDYDLLIPPRHTGKSIVCAAAVKKGLLDNQPEWINSFPEKFKLSSQGDDTQTAKISVTINQFSRSVLKFDVKPRSNGAPITIFVAHFKSKRPAEVHRENWFKVDKNYYKKHSNDLGYAISTIRRTAEAAALRMMIIDEVKNTEKPLVVIGDLNDSQLSNTMNLMTGQPNYLLSGLSRGGSDTGLYAVGTLQEYRSLRDVYYTHIYQNTKESLDHILVSQEFYDNSKKRIWAFLGMEIFNDHLNNDAHKVTGSTDHGVVKASFEYRPV